MGEIGHSPNQTYPIIVFRGIVHCHFGGSCPNHSNWALLHRANDTTAKKYYLYSILKYKDLTFKSTSISPRIRAQTKTEDVVRFPFDNICLRNGRFCWNWGGGLLPWNEILAIRTNTYFISTEHRWAFWTNKPYKLFDIVSRLLSDFYCCRCSMQRSAAVLQGVGMAPPLIHPAGPSTPCPSEAREPRMSDLRDPFFARNFRSLCVYNWLCMVTLRRFAAIPSWISESRTSNQSLPPLYCVKRWKWHLHKFM